MKREFARIKFLFRLQYFLLVLIFALEYTFHLAPFFECFCAVVGVSILARMTFKSLTQLYYSFWTFQFIFLALNFWKLGDYYFIDEKGLFFALILVNLGIIAYNSYVLFSPIYFPFTRWWIYDFRLRYDLEAKVKLVNGGEPNLALDNLVAGAEDHWYEARVSDIRRGYGCINIFEKLQQGAKIELKCSIEGKKFHFNCIIITAREYSFGRGHICGIKFIYNGMIEKRRLREFFQKWKWRKLIVKGRSLKMLKKVTPDD